jgi:hypothetical protein
MVWKYANHAAAAPASKWGQDRKSPLGHRAHKPPGGLRVGALLHAPAYRETGRPGLVIVPGAQYHVMISTVSRPARTAGSASASCLASSSEPVR